MDPKRKAPSYEELTNTGKKHLPDDQRFPAIFDRGVAPDGKLLPGTQRDHLRGIDKGRPKKVRLRDQLAAAFDGPGDRAGAIKLAAYAIGVDEKDVPEEAKATLGTLTAWVFAMRALGGSVEHFREIGDRIDPKPKRIEIEGVHGARSRGGAGSNPDEVAEADAYYRAISGEIVDAEFTDEGEEPAPAPADEDMSFLD